MKWNRRPDQELSSAAVPAEGASFIDTLMDLLEGAEAAAAADDAAQARAEAKLSRQFRAAIGARLRDAA